MNTARSTRKGAPLAMAAGFVMVLAAVLTPVAPASTDGEHIAISCYRENLDMGNRVGSILVLSTENAAQRCNSLYYDCNGKCIGCYSDSDLTEEVCYDGNGRKFLK